ncbi:glycoside hydrolase superfamily [Aspergillus venezuelensis]
MKWVIFITVLLLSCLAVAISIGTEDVISAPEVVIDVTVWVDEKGHTLSVETVKPTATVDNKPTALLILAVPGLDVPHELAPTLANDLNLNPKPKPHNEEASRPHDPEARSFGISYSPYNSDGTCKNQDQVTSDITKLRHYSYVRIYGVDCDQTKKNLHGNLKTIVDSAHPDLSTIHTISIGNELDNRNQNSATNVVTAVGDARAYLRTLGYKGPVVTIDTFSRVLEHPELCSVSDYCAANCHAFFDAHQTPDTTGSYVHDIARQLQDVSGGKRTLITESGWPHAGQSNGVAVPSPENQRTALQNLRQAFKGRQSDLVLFSAFDDGWKVDNQWTFGAEKFWGIERG